MTNIAANDTLSADVLFDIQKRVECVKAHFRTSSAAWLQVAQEFTTAKELLNQHAYERFVNDVGVTKAVADKLVLIGRETALYREELIDYVSTADGWTVLYELAKIGAKKLVEVIDVLKADRSKRLTRELIDNVANNRPSDEKVIVLASIEITSSKLKSITNAQWSLVTKKLAEIDSVLSSANGVVSYHKRNKSLQVVGNAAASNSTVQSVKTRLAA